MEAPQVPARTSAVGRALTTAALLTLIAAPVMGHSFVRSTSPRQGASLSEAPTQVVIRFNGQIEPSLGRVQVLAPDGTRVNAGAPRYDAETQATIRTGLAEGLTNGRYVVAWRVVAADGHTQRGRFAFRLDAPATPTPGPTATPTDQVLGTTKARPPGAGVETEGGPPLAPRFLLGVMRLLTFGALIILGGAVVFVIGVWLRPKGSGPVRPADIEERFRARWASVIRRAWQVAVGGTLLSIFLQGAVVAEARLTDVSLGLAWDVLGTRFGKVALFRLAVLAVGAVAWRRGIFDPRIWPTPRTGEALLGSTGVMTVAAPRSLTARTWFAGTWAVALLSSIGLAGHAGTTPPVLANLAADLVHVLGASAWAGGLIMLLGAAFPAVRGEDPRSRISVMAPLISRFSDIAVVSIGAVVASGIFRSWMELERLSDLAGTPYGRTLLIKLVVFVPVLVLGGINNRVTKPACEAALATGASDRGALDRLRRLVTVEVALAVVILGITAMLVNLPPPAGSAMHG